MNQSALSDIVALGEGFTTDFKRSGTTGLRREICAFANATGGTILLGVADDGAVCGVGNHNRLKSEVQSIARSADPPIAVEIESAGQVLCVRVPAQQSKPYSFGGKFFIREGASSQQMSREEIREFFFEEGLIRFDETPCRSFDLERDLTEENWERFGQRAGLPEGLEPVATLENLHLAKGGEMTHAGAWLLADDITRYTLRAGGDLRGPSGRDQNPHSRPEGVYRRPLFHLRGLHGLPSGQAQHGFDTPCAGKGRTARAP